MTEEEIVKVVNKLIGSIYPIADSNYDGKIINNILLMGNVLYSLICDMGNMICNKENSPYRSEIDCVNKRIRVLENIRDTIDEYLNDLQ